MLPREMGKRSGCTNKHGVHQPPESLMARRAARAQNHDAEGAAQASSSVLTLDPSTGAAFAREGAGQQRGEGDRGPRLLRNATRPCACRSVR